MLTREMDAPVRISYSPKHIGVVTMHAFHSTASESYMIMMAAVVISCIS